MTAPQNNKTSYFSLSQASSLFQQVSLGMIFRMIFSGSWQTDFKVTVLVTFLLFYIIYFIKENKLSFLPIPVSTPSLPPVEKHDLLACPHRWPSFISYKPQGRSAIKHNGLGSPTSIVTQVNDLRTCLQANYYRGVFSTLIPYSQMTRSCVELTWKLTIISAPCQLDTRIQHLLSHSLSCSSMVSCWY